MNVHVSAQWAIECHDRGKNLTSIAKAFLLSLLHGYSDVSWLFHSMTLSTS